MQLATEKQLLEFYGSKVELRMEKWVEIVFEGAFLTANDFESGPMPTSSKILDRPPLLPSCKLG